MDRWKGEGVRMERGKGEGTRRERWVWEGRGKCGEVGVVEGE